MNDTMSPTAVHLAAASAARDEAMRAAHEAEGKPWEATADREFAEAERLYQEAAAAHRAARVANGDNVTKVEEHCGHDSCAQRRTCLYI